MDTSIPAIREAFDAEIASATDAQALERIRAGYLGRQGQLTNYRKGVNFGALSEEERKALGQAFNEARTHIESVLEQRTGELAAKDRGPKLPFDITLPGLESRLGAIHPIISTQVQVEEIFTSMGFQVFTGDEAVSEYENFDALNIPADHPARDMQDTFWLENGMVLRTHTSSMQNRAMRQLGVPLRAIFPGRCFRNEATDLTHECTFYQLEGLMIDRDVSVANLIAVMRELLARIFPGEIEVRLRPGFFPFVEPGFELDFKSSVVGVSRWIELMPCGMVHPRVLQAGGVDPAEYSGFAFGLGLTRLAMLKYGIPDIRLFNRGDLRFLEQFVATL